MVARGQWQRFLLEAPEYPMGVFQGRGIAILAGGPQYLVPAWVNIRMLRAAGGLAIVCCVFLNTVIMVSSCAHLFAGSVCLMLHTVIQAVSCQWRCSSQKLSTHRQMWLQRCQSWALHLVLSPELLGVRWQAHRREQATRPWRQRFLGLH